MQTAVSTVDEPPRRVSLLEGEEVDLPIGERLVRAAIRIERGPASKPPGSVTLRPDQLAVFSDSASYLLDAATSPSEEQRSPFGRIVQPRAPARQSDIIARWSPGALRNGDVESHEWAWLVRLAWIIKSLHRGYLLCQLVAPGPRLRALR